MINYIERGDTITTIPASTAVSGDVIQLGSSLSSTPKSGLVGILANSYIDASTPVAVSIKGVFKVAKHTGEAFGQGDLLYWDATNKRATASTNSGANFFVGYAHTAQLSADTTVNLLLPQ